jgi:gamma-glutamyltranspeptidase/glutathione hydrolase
MLEPCARLAEAGPDDFYHGELARRMSEDIAANDGFVTAEDLAEYTLREESPAIGTYRGYTIVSSQAPHGGPTLIEALNILEGYDLPSLGHNSADYLFTVAMAMKAAFADRNRYIGDPAFDNVPVAWLTGKERAAQWRAQIDAGRPITVEALPDGPPDTTHVSVVDDAGNCVALTHSLGMSSGVITPGLGFMYNNSMINFNPIPGPPQLDSAAQRTRHRYVADDRVCWQSSGTGYRSAGGKPHHYRCAPGAGEHHRFRDESGGSSAGATFRLSG